IEVERHAAELIELSARHNFTFWLAAGVILRGWARSASGDTGGILRIEEGIKSYLATGSRINLPFVFALKAEAFHLADRTSEAFVVIRKSAELAERFEDRYWCAELHRLAGVFLATIRADEPKIEVAF